MTIGPTFASLFTAPVPVRNSVTVDGLSMPNVGAIKVVQVPVPFGYKPKDMPLSDPSKDTVSASRHSLLSEFGDVRIILSPIDDIENGILLVLNSALV